MRVLLLAALLATACSPAAETPSATESLVTLAAVVLPVSKDSCSDIAALAVALSEPEPFASLRSGAESGSRFTTNVSPAGATCALSRMAPVSPGGSDIHVANCLVFFSGMLDREATASKAKDVFDTARADLDRCLPQGWTSRDGSQPDANVTEVMIYESAADAKRSMDASSYLYPVELRKEWSDGGRANPPGWRVTLKFQKESAGKPAPDQR